MSQVIAKHSKHWKHRNYNAGNYISPQKTDFANLGEGLNANKEDENDPKCKVNLGPNVRSVVAKAPIVRMIHSVKEHSKEEVKKTNLETKLCDTEEKYLAPKKSEKVIIIKKHTVI